MKGCCCVSSGQFWEASSLKQTHRFGFLKSLNWRNFRSEDHYFDTCCKKYVQPCCVVQQLLQCCCCCFQGNQHLRSDGCLVSSSLSGGRDSQIHSVLHVLLYVFNYIIKVTASFMMSNCFSPGFEILTIKLENYFIKKNKNDSVFALMG